MTEKIYTDLPIRADVQAMQAYSVANADNCIKLDAMENPHRLPANLQEKLGQRLGKTAINRYPHKQVEQLKQELAKHNQLPTGYGVVLGNGSDELITLLSTAVLATAIEISQQQGNKTQPATIMAPQPSFVMYQITAQLLGLKFVGVPLKSDFQLDTTAMLAAIKQHKPALLFLAYPNNPTGTLWQTDDMLNIIKAVKQNSGIVVIDEAYQPFSPVTWLDKIKTKPNDNKHVVIIRTMSKLGLAGARLGYMFATSYLAEQINKVRPPYNVSTLNAECALFALEHHLQFSKQTENICQERNRLETELSKIEHIQCYPSHANMILIRCLDNANSAEKVHAGMLKRGVLIKNVSTMHPMLTNCLRLTVGSSEENTAMLAALKESL